MTWYALDSRKDADFAHEARILRRVKLVPTLMMVAIVGMVAVALIAEARLSPEQRLELFRCYDFPALP